MASPEMLLREIIDKANELSETVPDMSTGDAIQAQLLQAQAQARIAMAIERQARATEKNAEAIVFLANVINMKKV